MKYLLITLISLCLFACRKQENLLDNPEFQTIDAHTWQSDSAVSRANGVTTVSYSSADNYELFHIYFPTCGFVKYADGQAEDSSNYFLSYQPGKMLFAPNADTAVAAIVINYANIKSVTDSVLVLEKHISRDSSVPVVTMYYHAQ